MKSAEDEKHRLNTLRVIRDEMNRRGLFCNDKLERENITGVGWIESFNFGGAGGQVLFYTSTLCVHHVHGTCAARFIDLADPDMLDILEDHMRHL